MVSGAHNNVRRRTKLRLGTFCLFVVTFLIQEGSATSIDELPEVSKLLRASRSYDDHLLRYGRSNNARNAPLSDWASYARAARAAQQSVQQHLLRFNKRAETRPWVDDHMLRYSRAYYKQQQRQGKQTRSEGDAHLLRFNRAYDDHLLRFNRAYDDHLLRINRASDDHLLRFNKRSGGQDSHLLRFNRDPQYNILRPTRARLDDHMLRYGRSPEKVDDEENQISEGDEDDEVTKDESDPENDDYFKRLARSLGDDHLLRFNRAGKNVFERLNRYGK